jgi:hypothetical protein
MPTAIRIPDLAPSGCRALVVCGYVESEDKELLGRYKKDTELIARHRKGNHTFYIRALFRARNKRIHVHVEIISGDFLRKKIEPKTEHTVNDIQGAIAPFLGQRMDAVMDGVFTVPMAKLPFIIRSAMEEVRVNDVAVRMTAGTLSVRGAPIDQIEWRTAEKAKDALITLRGHQTIETAGPDYLENALNVIQGAFSLFVQGEQ